MEVTDTHRISLARCEDSFYTEVQTIRFMMSRYDLSEESSKELIADIKDRRQQENDIVSQYFNPEKK